MLDFHLNQPVYLQTSVLTSQSGKDEEKLQTLDVPRSLIFYLNRTEVFRVSLQLFIVFDRMKGNLFLHKGFLPISSCTSLCCDIAKVPISQRFSAHYESSGCVGLNHVLSVMFAGLRLGLLLIVLSSKPQEMMIDSDG